LRFEDVVITSDAPFQTRRYGCVRRDATEGSAFGYLLLGVDSAAKLGQQLRAIVHTTIARIEDTKLPVMNTCAKRVGGSPLPFSAFGIATRGWIRLPHRAGERTLKVRLFDPEELYVKD